MRKLFVTLGVFCALSLGTAIISSCGGDDCPGFENHQVTGIEIEGKLVISRVMLPDYTWQYVTTRYDGSPRRFDEVAIEISYGLEQLSMREPGISFGNQAYACSPPLLGNLLTELVIVSEQDYNDEFTAGTPLNRLFRFSRDAGFHAEGFGDSQLLDGPTLFFKPIFPPSQSQSFDFTFQMTFEDGSYREVTVEGILLE